MHNINLTIENSSKNNEQGQLCTLNEISDKLKTLSVDEDTRLIWGGDWNCILDKSLDAMGGRDHPLQKGNQLNLYKI